MRFKGVWEVYDERLQFMSRQDALLLHESLDADDDVSRAWLVWSGAADSALADAYQFSGGPLPGRGPVLGRGRASFRVVRLGGHRVRKARGNAADAHDAADVFLYRDSSVAPLLDMRRRFKAGDGCSGCHDSVWLSLFHGRWSSLLSGTGFLLLDLCILSLLMISVWSGAWGSVIFIVLFLMFIIV